MKKILFIPTYTYLSTPIFTKLLPTLQGYETIYLDVEDQYDCEETSEQFKNQFSRSIEIAMNADNSTFIANIVKLFKMIRYRDRLKKFIERESPSAIITTGDLIFSVRVIKAYFPEIPIFVIQPALFVAKGIPRKYSQKIIYRIFNKIFGIPIIRRQNYFGQEYTDTILFLWGEYFRKMLPDNKNINIVGDITFDNFPIEKDFELKRELLDGTGCALNSKIVTICTSVLENFTEQEVIDSLNEIYKQLIIKHKDLFFVIKPHPRSNIREVRDLFDAIPTTNYIVLNTNLHMIFKYTDIHISTFSRTAIEAIASKIPVISVNPDNKISLQDFLHNELNEKVTNTKEMHDKIEDILKNRDSYVVLGEEYIKNKLYKLDGNAAKRTTDIIKREIVP